MFLFSRKGIPLKITLEFHPSRNSREVLFNLIISLESQLQFKSNIVIIKEYTVHPIYICFYYYYFYCPCSNKGGPQAQPYIGIAKFLFSRKGISSKRSFKFHPSWNSRKILLNLKLAQKIIFSFCYIL